MDRRKRLAAAMIAGLLWTIVPVLLSRWLIRDLSELFRLVGNSLGMENSLVSQAALALIGLKTAALKSPCLIALVTGGGMGCLHYVLFNKKTSWLLIIALLPVTLLLLWFTTVNEIVFGAVLGQLLALLPGLL